MKKIGLVPELYVRNIEKSRYFYTTVLGFTVAYERPEEKFTYLTMGNAELMLEQPTNPERTWLTGELEYPFGRGINLQIEVENIDLLNKKIIDAEAQLFLEIEERWYVVEGKQKGNK